MVYIHNPASKAVFSKIIFCTTLHKSRIISSCNIVTNFSQGRCNMVVGKSQASIVQNKKRSSTSNKGATGPSVATPSTSTKLQCKPKQFAASSCCGCGTVITDDSKALQCDRCMSPTIWKCSECLYICDDMYE